MSRMERDRKNLDALRLVEYMARSMETIAWIWGGFTTDIYMGKILREHDDLDYLTLNLHSLKSKFAEVFSGIGWQAKDMENGDLSLKKENVKVQLGNVEFGTVATWTHNGERGSLCFPVSWLDLEVVEFYGIEVHVVAAELQYVLKEHPELLNPDWLLREKDILD